jgi:hypothetical protein
VQIETLNKRAQERYNSFVTALNMATDQINEVGKLIERMRKTKTAPGSWRVATPEQLRKLMKDSLLALEELKAHAKKYEAELVSRDWRV